jgi:hypothetical protein
MNAEHFQNGLYTDAVTCSAIDLQWAGPWKYAEDRSPDIECVGYAIGAGPISQWRPGESVPAEMGPHIAANLPIIDYGVSFERAIWCRILTPGYKLPKPGRENWHCTAARASETRDLSPNVPRIVH